MLTAKPSDKKFSDLDHNLQLSQVSGQSQQQNPQKNTIQRTQPKTFHDTDSVCCYVFVIFQLVCVGLIGYGLATGNLDKLAKPYDPDHRACGVDQGVEDYGYIYFATPVEKYLYRTVCVSACPTAQTTKLSCAVNSVVTSCKVDPEVNDLSEAVLVYDTVQYQSICLPTTNYYYLQLKDYLYPGFFQQGASDAYKFKLMIWITALGSIILGLAFTKLADRFPTFVVWAFLLFFIIGCALGGLINIVFYKVVSGPPQLPNSDTAQISGADLQQSTDSVNAIGLVFIVIGIICLIMALGGLLFIICFRKRIQLTIMMVKVAADFVTTNGNSILVPIVISSITYVVSIIYMEGALMLTASYPITDQPRQLPFSQVEKAPAQTAMLGIVVVGMVWFLCFAIGSVEFILTGAVSDWYYRQGNDRFSGNVQPVMESWQRLRNRHIGSVALGSGLIALASPFRFFMEYFHKLSKIDAKNNQVVSLVTSCCCCCLWAFDNCLTYFTKYAYVMINIDGTNFFKSAKAVVQLIDKDLPTFILVGGLGEIFLSLGRLFLSTFPTCLCYALAIYFGLLMPYVPAFFVFVITFSLSSMFMAIYGMSAEAIYLVYMHSQQQMNPEDQPQSTYQFSAFLQQAMRIS